MKASVRVSLWMSLLAAMLLGGGCNFGDPTNQASGGGTSIDGLTGNLVVTGGRPPAGATVRVYSAVGSAAMAKPVGAILVDSVTANSSGRFQFKNLPKGTYDLYATLRLADDTVFSLYRRGILVSGDTQVGTDTLQVVGSLAIEVRDGASAAIPGAVCSFAGGLWQAVSDSAGSCQFAELPPGTFRVEITHPAYPPAVSEDIVIKSGSLEAGGLVVLTGSGTLVPPAPVLVYPAYPVRAAQKTPLIWRKMAAATSYDVEVATDSDFVARVVVDSGLTDTTLIVENLSLPQRFFYYWRVRARNAVGIGPWSASLRFQTGASPTAPSGLIPLADARGSSLYPTLSWSGGGAGTPTFRVQVATDSLFTNVIVDDSLLTARQKTIGPLVAGTSYYWRLNASHLGTTTAWSNTRKFSTQLASQPTWTQRTSGTTVPLNAVAWGNNQFVAVGGQENGEKDSVVILTSADGTTWTRRPTSANYVLWGVTWGGSQWVAYGGVGTILTSPDGVTWTARTSGTGNTITALTWTGTQFVGMGIAQVNPDSSLVLSSPDGVTWTTHSIPLFIPSSMAWTGSSLVAAGPSGVKMSSDGVNWDWATPASGTYHAVAWTGQKILAAGEIASGTGLIASFTDGTSSTLNSSGTNHRIYGMHWDGTRALAVGEYQTITSSPDGTTWEVLMQGLANQNFLAVAGNGIRTVVVGEGGTILTSP